VARHYGFTDEEPDFIPSTKLRAGVNYDIKYWLGQGEEVQRLKSETADG